MFSFSRCLPAGLLAALLLTALGGCGGPPTSLQVTVTAADTGLPVAGASVTLLGGAGTLPGGTTNASGVASFTVPAGEVIATAAAAGYGAGSTAVNVQAGKANSAQITLPRTAPALVFHTFSGSAGSPTAQAATVTVTSSGGTQVFSGSTIGVGQSGYDAVTVPDLAPSTSYAYTVSAQGFATVTGSATTAQGATATEVDILLPAPTVSVEVQTSVVSPVAVGVTTGSAAVVTITAPDGTVTKVTTVNPPVGPSTASYDVANPPTVPLAASTTYQYSALFTQYVNQPGNPVTGSFTTPAASSGSGPFVVPIVYNPFPNPNGGPPTKALP